MSLLYGLLNDILKSVLDNLSAHLLHFSSTSFEFADDLLDIVSDLILGHKPPGCRMCGDVC